MHRAPLGQADQEFMRVGPTHRSVELHNAKHEPDEAPAYSAKLNHFPGMPSKGPFTGLDGREPRASSGPKGKRDVRGPETRRISNTPFEERLLIPRHVRRSDSSSKKCSRVLTEKPTSNRTAMMQASAVVRSAGPCHFQTRGGDGSASASGSARLLAPPGDLSPRYCVGDSSVALA
jgi:hypothetical protein